MNELKGTRTELNLLAAFAGESMARNRYEFYAKKAKKEGFVGISMLFEEAAVQERSHAKSFFKLVETVELEIGATYPAGGIGTTEENLCAAIRGEREEEEELYPGFARTAREEGFEEIGVLFASVAVAERRHRERFEAALQRLRAGTVFERDEPVRWVCEKCGYVHEGKKALGKCPACGHPRDYFVAEGG